MLASSMIAPDSQRPSAIDQGLRLEVRRAVRKSRLAPDFVCEVGRDRVIVFELRSAGAKFLLVFLHYLI